MTAHDTHITPDPKAAAGAAKLPLSALPWAVVAEVSVGMGEGALKYGFHNWRKSEGLQVMTYIEAAQRHLIAYTLGEDIDQDSGLCHISKAIPIILVSSVAPKRRTKASHFATNLLKSHLSPLEGAIQC